MNNWGYLILIAALIVLTASMLYARFAARSREKSLHHAPADFGMLRFENEEKASESFEERFERVSDPVVMDLKPVRNDSNGEEPEKEPSKSEDRYFDELQEAAAGLAMLMRSSPAQKRPGPVVFEPAAEEETEGEQLISELEEVVSSEESIQSEESLPIPCDEVLAESAAEEESLVETAEEGETGAAVEASVNHESPPAEFEEETVPEEMASISEAMDHIEALLDGPPAFEGETDAFVSTAPETAPASDSLEAVLGAPIAAQLVAIDAGLDELELLVVSIEDQLALLEDFIAVPVEAEVSEAA